MRIKVLPVPEKTPEESDAFISPDETRPKSHFPGRNIHPFSSLFCSFLTVISV